MNASPPYAPPPDHGLMILHEDEALLVLNKPAGLLSVPGRGPDKADCLASRVQRRFPDALTVHRLDMETSGLILMARGPAIQRALSELFARRQVSKRYAAVVAGRVDPPRGEIDLPLLTDWPNRPRQMVEPRLGKPSQTRYALRHFDVATDTSRIALEPLTGRSHQLRVHMLAIGHPILGDSLYAPAAVRHAAPRLLLHAEYLAFAHPLDGKPCEFEIAAEF